MKVTFHEVEIDLRDAPACPSCDGEMRPVLPGDNDYWPPFWGCKKYPDCGGSVSIEDFQDWEAGSEEEIWLWDD